MIEKLSEYKITSRDGSFINVENNMKIINTLVRRINELVDAVNELQEFADVADKHLAILIEENNTHEKQIDELQMKLEPEKCETHAKNVLTKSLRMDKEFAEAECARLQDKLDRTRKALDAAKYAIKNIQEDMKERKDGDDIWEIQKNLHDYCKTTIKQITALEQKDN